MAMINLELTSEDEDFVKNFESNQNDYPFTLKIKKINPSAILPTRGSEKAAGIDLYANITEPITIFPGKTVMFGSGIACEFPKGYWGMIVPRSSVGIKRHLNIPQGAAVIDEDYTAEIKLAFYNHGETPETIEPGERVAQMVLLPYVLFPIEEVEEIAETKRGGGGIGSTGR